MSIITGKIEILRSRFFTKVFYQVLNPLTSKPLHADFKTAIIDSGAAYSVFPLNDLYIEETGHDYMNGQAQELRGISVFDSKEAPLEGRMHFILLRLISAHNMKDSFIIAINPVVVDSVLALGEKKDDKPTLALKPYNCNGILGQNDFFNLCKIGFEKRAGNRCVDIENKEITTEVFVKQKYCGRTFNDDKDYAEYFKNSSEYFSGLVCALPNSAIAGEMGKAFFEMMKSKKA